MPCARVLSLLVSSGNRVHFMNGLCALGMSVIVLFCAPGSLGAEERLGAAARQKHRSLLLQAERDLARGALQEGLSAAEEALVIAESAADSLRLAAAQMVRGNLLLAGGDPESAARNFEKVVAASRAGVSSSPLSGSALHETALLNLANARIALGEREVASALYAEVVTSAEARGDATTAARASVNELRAQIDSPIGAFDWEVARATRARAISLPDSADKAMLLVHLGGTYARAAERGQAPRDEILKAGNEVLRAALSLADVTESQAVLNSVADQAYAQAAPQIRAPALGHLGSLYAEEGRYLEALALTGRALLQAARGEVEPELFRWHRQSARINAHLGNSDEAISSYAESIRILENNRSAITRNLQLSMSSTAQAEDLSQLYRTYVDRLLRRARSAKTEEARKEDLALARVTLEHLKGDELRDYFEDDCVVRYREKLTSVDSAAFDAVVVYPFLLDDRLELILSVGADLFQVVVDVDRIAINQAVEQFRYLLEKRSTQQYLRPSQRLYEWLIDPIQPLLDRFDPATLVFIPDGILRTVPMAALYDGEQFLIERYALGFTPGLELTDPRPIDAQNQKMLVAGVSEAVQGFSALPNVEREVDVVHELMGGERLFNQTFSREGMVDQIRAEQFGMIHIASHAEFSESSSGGFLLTHDGKMSFDDLAEAVGEAKYRENPLDLVILSACETADGNARAALGLSGVAVKAGARSALGTLWSVSDEATSEFMSKFYTSLREPQKSRAQAVREAQVRLLKDAAYAHPYYWSPFLLINSWL